MKLTRSEAHLEFMLCTPRIEALFSINLATISHQVWSNKLLIKVKNYYLFFHSQFDCSLSTGPMRWHEVICKKDFRWPDTYLSFDNIQMHVDIMLHEPATTRNFPKPYYLHLVLMTLDIGNWELIGLVTFHFICHTRIILWHEVLFCDNKSCSGLSE